MLNKSQWAARYSLGVAVVRAAIRHRTNAHAAEVAFFALLSLVPATVTMGGILHLFAKVGGPQLDSRGREGAAEAIRLLIGPKLADSVINPFVQTQLTQTRGIAVTGLVLTTWLASRIFYALSHGLDVAFDARDRRPSRVQRLFALSHALISVIVIALTLAIMVLGWHSGRTGIDHFFGEEPVVAQVWAFLRGPLLLMVMLGVLLGLYRYGPNVRLSWRECLPGAALAVVLWIFAVALFRAYLFVGAGAPTGIRSDDPKVILIGRAIGASIATGIWMYFSALAVLTGAELTGELRRRAHADGDTTDGPAWPSITRGGAIEWLRLPAADRFRPVRRPWMPSGAPPRGAGRVNGSGSGSASANGSGRAGTAPASDLEKEHG